MNKSTKPPNILFKTQHIIFLMLAAAHSIKLWCNTRTEFWNCWKTTVYLFAFQQRRFMSMCLNTCRGNLLLLLKIPFLIFHFLYSSFFLKLAIVMTFHLKVVFRNHLQKTPQQTDGKLFRFLYLVLYSPFSDWTRNRESRFRSN